jgi:tetratricopeptide (TPR) repeat protein
MILCSCEGASAQVTDNSSPIRLNQGNIEKTARVLAKAEEWTNSGVIVEKGSMYQIKAKGRWRVGVTCNWTGPDGIGAYGPLCWDLGGQIVKGYSHSVLIAKIGDQGMPFGVGNEVELSAKDSGILYLRINDGPGWCWKDEGYVDAKISLIDKPPSVSAASKESESKLNSESIRTEQAKTLYHEGNDYFEAKSYKEAAEAYKKAISLEDHFAPLYYNLAMAQVELGQKVEAIANLKRYLELRPNADNAPEVKKLIKSLAK